MPIPRCQIVPLADHQVSFQVGGVERLRWHYGTQYPRPFFFPLVGPAGLPLTRMGHPGAPDHDHHRSIWFAHHKVLGIDFWGDRTTARIRQKQWLCYQDGDNEAAMAVLLGWFDGHDPKELLEQELIAVLRPEKDGESLLELQSTFRPMAESLELGKTNFGFLAVRVGKSISTYFGGGTITGSGGQTGEPALFAKPAKWMDYSGEVTHRQVEGITYFDHPSNPGYPVSWHVREDGWMGAAPCLNDAVIIRGAKPLVLRYLLHAHAGHVDSARANETANRFAASQELEAVRSQRKHTCTRFGALARNEVAPLSGIRSLTKWATDRSLCGLREILFERTAARTRRKRSANLVLFVFSGVEYFAVTCDLLWCLGRWHGLCRRVTRA